MILFLSSSEPIHVYLQLALIPYPYLSSCKNKIRHILNLVAGLGETDKDRFSSSTLIPGDFSAFGGYGNYSRKTDQYLPYPFLMGKPKAQRVLHRTHIHQNLRGKKSKQYFPESRAHRKAFRKGKSAGGMELQRNLLTGVYSLTQTANGVTIDSLIFRLNTNATVLLLVTFSIAVTTRQYVGHPIDCVHIR
ncbi:hypothetical protein JTB14_004022 [Gonioctena quinquepunctata]|nr:hypothetical protein JTB14_004022 [Gonioctena quinquepunctata]